MNKVVMYSVLEDPYVAVAENVQVTDTNNLFYLNFDTVLQRLRTKNRNGRTYMDATGKALFSDHLVELRNKKSWFGESGHPVTDDPGRITTILPHLTSHRINTVEVVGEYIRGNIDTLDNGHYGNMMTKMILQGMEPAFSLRALARIDNGPNGKVVNSEPRITTYDWIVLPSHKEAYRDMSTPIKAVSGEQNTHVVAESAIPIFESDIIEYAKTQSDNFKIVKEMLDFDNIYMSPDLNLVLESYTDEAFGTKDKHILPMDKTIKRDIMNYMAKL